MVIEYINRKNEAHYIKATLTKYGKERYYVVKDRKKYPDSQLLSDVPTGFEFYEFPDDGRVVLRKRLKTIISKEDINILKEVMDDHATVNDFIIDRTKDSAVIYLPGLNKEEWPFEQDLFQKILTYFPVLNFLKNKNGSYEAQRFCQLSAYFGWITMETGNDLYALAEKYCYHIDKESLLNFWIEGEEDF